MDAQHCPSLQLPPLICSALPFAPLRCRFVEGEGKEADARRNKRFKLIPNIPQARSHTWLDTPGWVPLA